MNNKVLTESILFVSSETVKMTGRVLESTDNLSDHGFEISVSGDFQNPITVSLSEKKDLGVFSAIYAGLDIESDYYLRAYITFEGKNIYGDIKPFTTLTPNVFSFSPQIAKSGDLVTIKAQNITSDIEIYFGNKKAEIVNIQFESKIDIIVPPLLDEFRVPINLVTAGKQFHLDTFEYVIGAWRSESLEFPVDDINLFEPIYAQTESNFVFGLGYDQIKRRNDVVWSLDFDSWSWSSEKYDGQFNRSPFIEEDIFGGGIEGIVFGNAAYNKEFNRVNSSGGVESLGDLPFNIYKGIASMIDGELYVYGGLQYPDRLNLDVWKYDGSSWETLGRHPAVPYASNIEVDSIENAISSDLPNFTINNRSFFVLSAKVWEFDKETLGFIEHDRAPIRNCVDGAYQVMNDKVYLGLCKGTGDDFFEYDPINKIWKEKTRFIFSRNGYNAGSFQYNDRLYFMINLFAIERSISGPIKLYSLDPNAF